MAEQRQSKRFALRLPVEYVRPGLDRSTKHAITENLSSGGVLISTDSPFQIGEPVEYFITLPAENGGKAGARLRCLGKVVRSEGSASHEEADSPRYTVAVTLERYEFQRQERRS